MERRTFAIVFVIAFIFLTYYLWQNNDYIAQVIIMNGLHGVFWYFISNANYVLILISIVVLETNVNFFRRLLGGVLLIFAFDSVSYPRLNLLDIQNLVTQSAGSISILASSDGLVIHQLLKFGFTPSVAYTIYYLVMPIAIVLLALYVLGFSNFLDILFGRR